jgi:hypothetical protein
MDTDEGNRLTTEGTEDAERAERDKTSTTDERG